MSELSALDEAPWDGSVSADPASSRFCFSFGGAALFVIGLSPTSPDPLRRFDYPTLVFNPNYQFDLLRKQHRLQRWKSVIRRRADAERGYSNELLVDYGEAPGWPQYSMLPGVATCPFRPDTAVPGSDVSAVPRVRSDEAHVARASFEDFASSSACIGARSVARDGTLRFVLLDELGSRSATTRLADHLLKFVGARAA